MTWPGTNSFWIIRSVSKKQMTMDSLLLHFLWIRWRWTLLLRQLLFGFKIISINPSFISSDNLRKKLWVILKNFLQICMWWCFCSSLSSCSMNFVTMCIMLSSSDNIVWHVPYDSLTMLQKFWMLHLPSSMIAVQTVATFSGVMLVEIHSKWGSSSTSVKPSLKHFNPVTGLR